jgi:predicted nucleic acid-binding protein
MENRTKNSWGVKWTVVADASVLLKPVLAEEGKETVMKLFLMKDNFEISILVPEIFRYELFNTVIRKKNGSIAKKALDAISEKQFSVIPYQDDIGEITRHLMQKYPGISFYDASYHALAKAYNISYLTADTKYLAAVKGEKDIIPFDSVKIGENLEILF